MFGYADESGEPGVKKNEHDFFVFCTVLFKDRNEAKKCQEKIGAFRKRMGLPDSHEFHFVKDSKRVKSAFLQFMSKLEFGFIAVSIKKDMYQKTASFVEMAEAILKTLEDNCISATITMDTNPRLYKELRVRKKKYNVILHFSEKKSRGHDLIQLADYVTAIKTRSLKYGYRPAIMRQYKAIEKKLIGESKM